MVRKQRFRSALAGQTAVLALAVAWGAMMPLGVDRDGKGLWSVHLNVALADRGRGGGSDGGSGGSGGSDSGGGGSGGDSDGGSSGGGSGSGGGNSGGGGSGSGGDSDGGSSGGGSSGGGSSGHDSSGSGSSGNSGSGGGGDDHGGSGSHGSGSDDAGDDSGSSNRGARSSDDDSPSGRSRGADDRDRPRATVDMSDSDVAAVMRGERVLVDDRGRVLEVEVEIEHGVRTVTVKPHGGDARRNPGPIGSIRTVDTTGQPARSVIAHPTAGGFELEVEHGAVVQKPHGGASAAAVPAGRSRDPVQVGDDLSPEQESALIQGGWR